MWILLLFGIIFWINDMPLSLSKGIGGNSPIFIQLILD
jgi:hypothetical protein